MPEATASSTPYWMIGLSTSGSISLGCALVAGRNRVPRPAAGKTALRTIGTRSHRSRIDVPRNDTNGRRGTHARSGLRPRSHRGRSAPACAIAASIPTRRSRRSRTLETARRRADSRSRRTEARAEHVGRRDRARQAAGAGHRPPFRKPTARAASRSSSSASQLDAIEHQRTQPLLDAAEPAARERAGRQERRPTTSRCGASASRARSTSSRRRTGTSARRSASSTSSAARKIAGARFSVLSGAGARLVARADQLHARPPHARARLPRGRAAVPRQHARRCTGTGQPAEVRGRTCSRSPATGTSTSIPTAEVPLTNLHRGEILDGRELPIRYTAYTPCFRSEAGSYGAGRARPDPPAPVRQGRARQARRRRSSRYDELEALTANAEEVLKRLELPYRTVLLCTGDMGFAVGEDLRHRGLAAEPEDVPRDLVLQQHRGVPGAPREHQVPRRRHAARRSSCTR